MKTGVDVGLSLVRCHFHLTCHFQTKPMCETAQHIVKILEPVIQQWFGVIVDMSSLDQDTKRYMLTPWRITQCRWSPIHKYSSGWTPQKAERISSRSAYLCLAKVYICTCRPESFVSPGVAYIKLRLFFSHEVMFCWLKYKWNRFYAYFTDSPDGICSYHWSLVSVVVHFPTLIQDMFDPAVFFLEQPTLAVLGGWLRGSIQNLISSYIIYHLISLQWVFFSIPAHSRTHEIA